jgi:glycosyltransferase involved in cell wall biosynthesis
MRIALLTTDARTCKKEFSKPAPYFGSAPAALLDGLATLPEAEVHVVSCARQPMRSPAKLAPDIWFHGLHVPRIGWMRTAYQGCVRAVRRKLREIRPDIVHGQGTELDCALDAVFSGFPNIVTIHGNMRAIGRATNARPFSFPWLAARLERFTVPRADGVVCITRHTQAQVNGLAKRTWLIPNAVDASFFEISPRPVATSHLILCVGTIYPLKNQNTLIQALDSIARQLDLKVLFLGELGDDSSYSSQFQHLVAERSWCVYGGFADRTEFKAHLARASLLVLPSLEENCPMAVLEAMAAGVPVVVARVGGLVDLVEEGQTGRFCNPFDQSTMTAAIQGALAHPCAMATMARLAKARARERFHPVVIARRHLEIYHELLRSAL